MTLTGDNLEEYFTCTDLIFLFYTTLENEYYSMLHLKNMQISIPLCKIMYKILFLCSVCGNCHLPGLQLPPPADKCFGDTKMCFPSAQIIPELWKVVSQTCWELRSYSYLCQLHPCTKGNASQLQKGNVSFRMDYNSWRLQRSSGWADGLTSHYNAWCGKCQVCRCSQILMHLHYTYFLCMDGSWCKHLHTTPCWLELTVSKTMNI